MYVCLKQPRGDEERYVSRAAAKETRRCPTRCPNGIHFFVNFDIFKWLYLSEN